MVSLGSICREAGGESGSGGHSSNAPTHLFLVSEAVSNVFWRLSSSSRRVVERVSAGVGRAEDMGFVMPQVFSVVSIAKLGSLCDLCDLCDLYDLCDVVYGRWLPVAGCSSLAGSLMKERAGGGVRGIGVLYRRRVHGRGIGWTKAKQKLGASLCGCDNGDRARIIMRVGPGPRPREWNS